MLSLVRAPFCPALARGAMSLAFAAPAEQRGSLIGQLHSLRHSCHPAHRGSTLLGRETAAVASIAGAFALQSALRGRRTRFSQGGDSWARRQAARALSVTVPSSGSATVACRAQDDEAVVPQQVPVVLLSGFLGTGKTTLLRHWLENAEGRIGIVVNDVAAVNIDSKLVQQQTYGSNGKVDAIQLQNGCACCSLGDEFLLTIYDLLALQTDDGEPFSQIVVELSGVAEPQRVREMFEQATASGSPIVAGVKLSKVVTLLDASTFCTEYMEWSSLMEREDLLDEDPGELAECKVTELLVEQTEAADVVVLNKTDLATKEQVDATRAVVAAINTKASLVETSFGKVALSTVLNAEEQHEAAADHGHESDHRSDHSCHDEHGHAEHAHAGHGHAEHGHEEHGHAHASDCSDPSCTDSSHGHSHGHAEACSDPDCTDESHGHDHGHSHSHSAITTAQERFGISSFTYVSRRPFHEERFTEALKKWPVPKQDDLGLLLSEPSRDGEHPLSRVVRSKGFCWLEGHPSSRMYWSHAGKDMRLNYEGLWWGAMTEAQLKMMTSLSAGEYERARREDWSDEFADRRQEIVFIGQRVDEAAVRAILDECLLTDEELDAYKERQEADKQELETMWAQQYNA